MATAYVEIRAISASGTWPRRGPDKGVFVQIVPEGEKPLRVLNNKVARKRGIVIVKCGVGYGRRDISPKSMYCQAVAKAEKIVDAINK